MWPESAVESGMLGKSEFTKGVMTQILGAYCRWVYSECDVITVLSPGFAELLRERGVDSRKIEIIYNWADDDLFKPMEPRAELARELGLAGRFNVVYAGNLGVFQGLESVLRAAAMLRDRPEIQFVLVGTGTEESRLRSLAAQMGTDNVRFLGQRPITEMPAINALADVLLIHLRDFPFFRMTIPGKTQISLASGRPIIMAVDGDAADIIRRAGAGLTVPPEQPEALAQAVVRMYETPRDERERIGASGREYYIQEMCMDAGADRMARLFQGLRGARSEPWVKTA
jgi:glycosyltransferase involved in cell wall biosynthesis